MTDFTTIANELTARRAEVNALMEQFKHKMKQEFASLTAYFFEETGLEAVIWNQYTPSFNDGEPCTFTLGDAVFVRKGFLTDEDGNLVDDVENYLESADNYEDDLYNPVPVGYYGRKSKDPLTPICDTFQQILNDNEDLLESLYGADGYGVTVYLTKDRVYEAEYDCGY